MKITAIILCAGSGSRTGLGYNKLFYNNGLGTVLDLTLTTFLSCERVGSVILTYSKKDKSQVAEITKTSDKITAALGGATRFESVNNALKASKGCDIVLIHDGARPFVTREIIDSAIDSAIQYGSGISAIPVVDTIKVTQNGIIKSTPDRSNLYSAQTPQAFRYDLISQAYNKATDNRQPSTNFTDDASVLEWYGTPPRLSLGSPDNIKITSPTDLAKLPSNCKIGLGYDVHRFAKDRKLILGGVQIPHPFGLLGHSDADVLTHAIMDALLSATGLPDIGVLFPDTDNAYKGADSIELLKKVTQKVTDFTIVNISCVIMAQAPKLSPHIQKMRIKLADTLNIKIDQINISATTTEGLGITATADQNGGIAASCNVLIRE
ncbi:MAG: 2-C-methyl-D-erythritol 4-phosphate cytidylyltransferase [Firmicutes bacterium]|nr:2-C-methyl-D-erythritol 4-phosphate cytidylyltransferase [Bacillota bacterium]